MIVGHLTPFLINAPPPPTFMIGLRQALYFSRSVTLSVLRNAVSNFNHYRIKSLYVNALTPTPPAPHGFHGHYVALEPSYFKFHYAIHSPYLEIFFHRHIAPLCPPLDFPLYH